MAGAVATTAVGADVAARDTAAVARTDPAVLSVKRAGMMMVRFMGMISPWCLQRSAACRSAPPGPHDVSASYMGTASIRRFDALIHTLSGFFPCKIVIAFFVFS